MFLFINFEDLAVKMYFKNLKTARQKNENCTDRVGQYLNTNFFEKILLTKL